MIAITTSLQTTPLVTVAMSPPVARITLSRPPLNIIDIAMMGQLVGTLAEVEDRPDISVTVISGAGASFSAGVEVSEHTPDRVERMLSQFHAVIRAVIASGKVTIAAVHGNCLGGGAELAMVCDMVVTTSTAHWGFPEIKLGCFPPVACAALAALVGQKRAAELILTGRAITGAEAVGIGLANRSVSENDLAQAVEEVVQSLSRLSPAALSIAKKALYVRDAAHFDKGLTRSERIYLEDLVRTRDAGEGILAFMEKRPPHWTGK